MQANNLSIGRVSSMKKGFRGYKKILSGALALSLMACLPFGISASGSNEGSGEDQLNKNYESVLLYNSVLSLVSMENAESSVSRSAPSNESTYAGAYIDNEDNLHVLLTDDSSPEFREMISEQDSSIVLEKAEYSFDYLSENLDIIRNNYDVLTEAGAHTDYISDSDNRIIIRMNDTSEENVNMIKAIDGLDSDTIIFEEQINNSSRSNSRVASAGNMVNNGTSGVTVGFGCQYDGFDGFVTVGHGLSVGNKIYQGTSQSNKVGDVYRRRYNTTMDASFVRCDIGDEPGTRVLTNSHFGGANQNLEIPEGTTVRKIGGTSGNKSGKIIDNNVGHDFGDEIGYSTGFTEVSGFVSQPGDSGAPIVMNQLNADNGGYVLEGMVIGHGTSSTFFYSYLRIKNSLGVSMSPYFD